MGESSTKTMTSASIKVDMMKAGQIPRPVRQFKLIMKALLICILKTGFNVMLRYVMSKVSTHAAEFWIRCKLESLGKTKEQGFTIVWVAGDKSIWSGRDFDWRRDLRREGNKLKLNDDKMMHWFWRDCAGLKSWSFSTKNQFCPCWAVGSSLPSMTWYLKYILNVYQ